MGSPLPRNRRTNARLTIATLGAPTRSRESMSRPRASRMPYVLNQSGLTALIHEARSRPFNGESGGTTIRVFQPARAVGVVKERAALATPGTADAASRR